MRVGRWELLVLEIKMHFTTEMLLPFPKELVESKPYLIKAVYKDHRARVHLECAKPTSLRS